MSIASYWDASADTFDAEPDHGLGDPRVRAAWADRLHTWVPDASAEVLDLGCGTGSLSAVLAGQGHRVTGVDLAPNMVERARRKLASTGRTAEFLIGDAGDPPTGRRRFDAVVARHLLWTLPNPLAALRRWVTLLRPGGRLILIEGRWATSASATPYTADAPVLPWLGGVSATTLEAAVQPLVRGLLVEPLTEPALWGKVIHDERYALLAHT